MKLQAHQDLVAALDFNSSVLATGYEDSRIGIWSLSEPPPPPSSSAAVAAAESSSLPSQVLTLSGHNGGVTGLQINGDLLASGSYDGSVKLWNIHNGNCLKTFEDPDNFVR